MMKICKLMQEFKPVMIMVVVQLCFAGVNVFYKLAAFDGINLRVLIAYRFIFSSAFLIPLALIFERKSRHKLTKTVLLQAFLTGLFGGTLPQNFYLEGLVLTSSTFASAINNLIPAITFVLAISFRMEKTGLRTVAGKAKVMGTLIGISGAMLLTFYKGTEIHIWSPHFNLMNLLKPHGGHVAASDGTRVLGSLFCLGSSITLSMWFIIQAKMTAKFPFPYSSTALMATMAALQDVVFTLCFVRDWSQWKLGWNIRLFAAAYAGIIVSSMTYIMMTWCVRLKGPLFTTAFYPLMLVFSTLEGYLLLDERLYVGSIIGATLIVCGLYAVLWGKDKETKKMSELIPLKGSKEAEMIPTTNSISDNNDENCNRSINEEEDENVKEDARTK